MKIYTKTGDEGDTVLFGGPRVSKRDPRIEAYGEVDELNAVLGLARASPLPQEFDALVGRIQHELFAVGAELATPDPAKHNTVLIGQSHVTALEQAIDHFDAGLAPLKQFILPGGTPGAAALHVARTVCRRAERRVVALSQQRGETISPRLIVYLNRLSDLLFVLARAANAAAGVPDVAWQKPM
jgi:cob(I)alamin adenosyltransferase